MGRRNDHMDEESVRVLARIEDETDPRVCCIALKKRIEQLERAGQPVPQPLLIAQHQLMTELIAESQGR